MEGFGIVLQSVGAILIAYSQSQMNRTISLWLQTLDLTVDRLTRGENVVRVTGLDRHWARDLRRDRWMSPIGWLAFMAGYFMLIYELLTRTAH
jgi:hypothetical protein